MQNIIVTAAGMMEGLVPLTLHEGSILIEGEIGSGKTALLARILARLNKDDLDIVLCYDPRREKTAYEEFARDSRVRVYKSRLWNNRDYFNWREKRNDERETLFLVDGWSPDAAADAASLAATLPPATEHVVLTSSWPVEQTLWSTVIQCRRSNRYTVEMKGPGWRDVSADVTVPDFQYGR